MPHAVAACEGVRLAWYGHVEKVTTLVWGLARFCTVLHHTLIAMLSVVRADVGLAPQQYVGGTALTVAAIGPVRMLLMASCVALLAA